MRLINIGFGNMVSANRLVAIVYTALCFLLCASQLVYYRIFGTFYTFFSMTNGAGAIQAAYHTDDVV